MKRTINLKKAQIDHFDLVVVGGGATGAGVALDGVTRGLKVLLIEKNDYAQGTSSKSTKMLHGGVRYLEDAILNLDRTNFLLVKEGLEERGYALKNMQHLAHVKKFVTPLYSWIDIPKVYIGLKIYDLLAGSFRIGKSAFLTRSNVEKNYPHINKKNLKGAVTYYDVQFNDVRANINILLTAQQKGAVILNYAELTEFERCNNKIVGVKIKDKLTDTFFNVKTKVVINATGPFVDTIRHIDDNRLKPLLALSSGIHIVLNKSFLKSKEGVLIPSTEDNRVLFVLPWENSTLIGTTDNRCELTDNPKVSKQDINYLLKYINQYFNLEVTEKDIVSSWSGIRPLVFDDTKKESHKFLRTHHIEISASGLITIAGGKWTAYRKMAQDVIDTAIAKFDLKSLSISTKNLPILGSDNFNKNLYQNLMHKFSLEKDVAMHLQNFYGSYAEQVAQFCIDKKLTKRLHEFYPYLEGEVVYVYENEMAISSDDVLSRRLLLKMIDIYAANKVKNRVTQLLELKS